MEATKKEKYDLNQAEALFEKYIKDFEKQYKDEEDKRIHYEMFVKSLAKINKLNSDPKSITNFGLTKFADYTEEEMQLMFGGSMENEESQ